MQALRAYQTAYKSTQVLMGVHIGVHFSNAKLVLLINQHDVSLC